MLELVDPPALARVAELVYAYGSEPYLERVGGSSPLPGTSSGGQAQAGLRSQCPQGREGPSPSWDTIMVK